jgi:hypothetical protein
MADDLSRAVRLGRDKAPDEEILQPIGCDAHKVFVAVNEKGYAGLEALLIPFCAAPQGLFAGEPSRSSPVSARGLTATWVMHCFTVKISTVLRWTLAARGPGPAVALTKVEAMINVSIETIRAVEPRSCPDEYTAREPLRTIVAVWSAVIRRDFIVSVRTNRRFSDAHGNLRRRVIGSSHDKAHVNSHETQSSQDVHRVTSHT